MPFVDHLTILEPTNRRRKRHHPLQSSNDMSFFVRSSSHFLNPPPAPSRKISQRLVRTNDNVDDFLSSDLEISFASNVSLNSPPQEHLSLPPDYEPMDISPAPPIKPLGRFIDASKPQSNRPRAFTSGARLFGHDISNNENTLFPSPQIVSAPTHKAMGSTSAKRTQRAALPTEWLAAACVPEPLVHDEPSSPLDDPMDVDTSYAVDTVPPPVTFSPVPHSAAPTITTFNQLFYDTMSPRRSFESPTRPVTKKRRSLSPESPPIFAQDGSSSPMAPSSPSVAKLERMNTAALASRMSKPTLQGLGAPSANFFKRPRRPVLSAVVEPSKHQAQSAYPVLLSQASTFDDPSPRGSAPVRRAFSAFLPPSIYTAQEEDESSFDSQDMSSPAQAYSKRQQVKTIRRCDGTEDFRPLTGVTAMVEKESPSAKHMSPGLPGFGDNEAHGKILPCHRVREDGLMRINGQTLDALMDGKYNDFIIDFHIIDCRFDYEYNGGHIPGAVNINTTETIEEMLLGLSLTKPRPCVSGDQAKKTILVFHCEFSAKRAPTFAKHLRAKDRAMNNHIYPKIHYPEVYILEGGYCQYFKLSAHRCEPSAYVRMDDPNYASSRREDLDQFRKARFGRHKSYAYGDGPAKSLAQQQQQPKRNTVPNAPQSLFAAATAARSRRGGAGGLMTLAEDANATVDADDTDTDIGDSPCPPPTKATILKGKKTGRSMVRSESYGPTRMPY